MTRPNERVFRLVGGRFRLSPHASEPARSHQRIKHLRAEWTRGPQVREGEATVAQGAAARIRVATVRLSEALTSEGTHGAENESVLSELSGSRGPDPDWASGRGRHDPDGSLEPQRCRVHQLSFLVDLGA
jgi:hypothetical protein